MLNRHNIRVKVLQSLYAQQMQGEVSPVIAERYYMKMCQNGYKLYLYNLYFLQQIAQENQREYEIRQQKLLPTAEDKAFVPRLYQNPIMEFLRNNEGWKKLLKSELITHMIGTEQVKKFYQEFIASEYYQNTYLKGQNFPLKEHQYCLVNLYKMVIEHDDFRELLDDHFPTWEEDISLLYGAVKNTIREFPNNPLFYQDYKINEEILNDFGKALLYQVVNNDQKLQPLIAEKLQNWSEDRIATMDMLIIKMAMCEFWFHPSIPSKVTIDEYVLIGKEYSTDKSKRFLNGILDRLMRDEQQKGHIQKSGRGLVDTNPEAKRENSPQETADNQPKE